ncbi:MAG: hypothetical protein M5R36_12580 [Deltaproteobacteria bacterium]|nr:hypothetical protein [Deltaproteobacteria bacterium]
MITPLGPVPRRISGIAARGPRAGYALVAALMVMLMVTLLGIMAMVTSTSEMRIANNMGEDKLMFGHGEQGVQRVLSHLHYFQEGLYGLSEGAGFTNNNVKQVIDESESSSGLVIQISPFGPTSGVNSPPRSGCRPGSIRRITPATTTKAIPARRRCRSVCETWHRAS